jgi:transposase InsO family protein
VSFICDAFSRMIVGWQIATHMRTELVLDALEMAVFRRDVTGPLIHHSDAGWIYWYNERVITRTCGCWIAARARRTFLTEKP